MSQQQDDERSDVVSFLQMIERNESSGEGREIDIEIDLPEEGVPQAEEESVELEEEREENVLDLGNLDESSINDAISSETRLIESSVQEAPQVPGEIYIDVDLPAQEVPVQQHDASGPSPRIHDGAIPEAVVEEVDPEMEIPSAEIEFPPTSPVPIPSPPDISIVESSRSSQLRAALESFSMDEWNSHFARRISPSEVEELQYLEERLRRGMINDVPKELLVFGSEIEADPRSIGENLVVEKVSGNPFLVQKKPSDIALFEVVEGKLVSKEVDPYFEMLYDIVKKASFDFIAIGFIEETIESKKFVMFDCLNYNGKYIGDKPYIYRYQILHKIGAILLNDDISVINLIFDTSSFFEKKEEGSEFFAINKDHVIGGGPLFQRCKLSKKRIERS